MVNPPAATLEDVEDYAEQTQSSLLYLALGARHVPLGLLWLVPYYSAAQLETRGPSTLSEAVGVRDTAADHVASHVGKAAGLVTAIRGLPMHSAMSQVRDPSFRAARLTLFLTSPPCVGKPAVHPRRHHARPQLVRRRARVALPQACSSRVLGRRPR